MFAYSITFAIARQQYLVYIKASSIEDAIQTLKDSLPGIEPTILQIVRTTIH